MRSTLTLTALSLATAGLLTTTLTGCDDETAEAPPQPMPVAPVQPPTPVPQPTTNTGNRAMVLPPAAGAIVGPTLKGAAQSETRGMSEDGPAVVASFMQGQVHEQEFMIQPGRCYTVVGIGLTVVELDIVVVVNQPPAPEAIIAQDDRTGPQSVVGGAGRCTTSTSPVPLPVKIRTTATKGSGVVMTQVYSK